jgi:hypothetical protein
MGTKGKANNREAKAVIAHKLRRRQQVSMRQLSRRRWRRLYRQGLRAMEATS